MVRPVVPMARSHHERCGYDFGKERAWGHAPLVGRDEAGRQIQKGALASAGRPKIATICPHGTRKLMSRRTSSRVLSFDRKCLKTFSNAIAAALARSDTDTRCSSPGAASMLVAL